MESVVKNANIYTETFFYIFGLFVKLTDTELDDSFGSRGLWAGSNCCTGDMTTRERKKELQDLVSPWPLIKKKKRFIDVKTPLFSLLALKLESTAEQ